MSDPIYLDYNAITPVAPEVADANEPYLREHFGNLSGARFTGAVPRVLLGRFLGKTLR